MKFFLSVLICVFLCSQVAAQDTTITFQGVIPVDTALKKNELFTQALEWVGTTFNSAQKVIDVQDKESGKIILKAAFRYKQLVTLASFDLLMHYTAVLSFKDGRYKYEFTDFMPETNNKKLPSMTSGNEPNKAFVYNFGKRGWKNTQQTINENMQSVIQSLITHMKHSTKSDNW